MNARGGSADPLLPDRATPPRRSSARVLVGRLARQVAVRKTGTPSSMPIRSATTSASAQAAPFALVEVDDRHDVHRADMGVLADAYLAA